MAKTTRKKKEVDSDIIRALKFVSLAQQEIGVPYQTHCRFINGEIIGFDGILAAGHPVEGEIAVCPHTFRLINALERATGQYSIAVLDNMQLSIKTDKFRALVDCIGPNDIQYIIADPPSYPLTDTFREAAVSAGAFAMEGSTIVAYASVMTRDGSLIGTNGEVFIEAWHGSPTPPGLIMPKAFVTALNKIAKKIVSFGYSVDNRGEALSFTVHFEDASWLKTQLYVGERYPSLDLVFAWTETAHPVDPPKGFFDAIRAVEKFNENKQVFLAEGAVRSHDNDMTGATYELKGITENVRFNSKYLLQLETFITKLDLTGNEKCACFFGGNDRIKIRGAIAKSH